MSAPSTTKGPAHPLRCPKPHNHKSRVHYPGSRPINQTDVVATERHQALIRQIGLVPPYFVLAFANKMKVDTLCERLQGAGLISPPPGKSDDPKDDGHAPQPPLDAVCVLGQGVFLSK